MGKNTEDHIPALLKLGRRGGQGERTYKRHDHSVSEITGEKMSGDTQIQVTNY